MAVKEKSEKKPVEQKMHVVEIILCVILITVFVFVKCIAVESMKIRRDIFYTISSTEEGIEDAANSLEKNVAVLAKLDPNAGWNKLSMEEKVDLLTTVVKVECRHLGMRDSAPTLLITNLLDGTDGKYDYMTDSVTLSYISLIKCNSSGYKIVEALCKEMFCRYQSYMADIPSVDAKLMPLAGVIRYEPKYDRISEELAEIEYGRERVKDYNTAIWRYLVGIKE